MWGNEEPLDSVLDFLLQPALVGERNSFSVDINADVD